MECLGGVVLLQSVAVESLRIASLRAILHIMNVAVVATENSNWGILGAESVADLLHHAPVFVKVWLSGTVACAANCCHLLILHTVACAANCCHLLILHTHSRPMYHAGM